MWNTILKKTWDFAWNISIKSTQESKLLGYIKITQMHSLRQWIHFTVSLHVRDLSLIILLFYYIFVNIRSMPVLHNA